MKIYPNYTFEHKCFFCDKENAKENLGEEIILFHVYKYLPPTGVEYSQLNISLPMGNNCLRFRKLIRWINLILIILVTLSMVLLCVFSIENKLSFEFYLTIIISIILSLYLSIWLIIPLEWLFCKLNKTKSLSNANQYLPVSLLKKDKWRKLKPRNLAILTIIQEAKYFKDKEYIKTFTRIEKECHCIIE